MFNLAAFSLRAVTECTAQLRNIGLRAANTVDVGSRIAHYLYRHLGDAKAGKLHCALVRVFITTSYGHLDVESQRLAQEALGRNPSSMAMKCLTLIGTAGEREEWNNRAQSRRFRVIPLASEGFVAQFPMFSQLFQQLGVKLQSPVPSESDLLLDWEEKTYNVFYVRDAVGSCFVPVQRQFVIPYEIKSVLGFGGVLPSKELFAVILFSKVRIPHHTADMFKTLALGTKLALLPFDTRRTPSIPSSRGAAITATPRASTEGTRKLRSRIETLEHLLEVHEETTREQSGTLEQAIEELKNKSQTLERREAAIQEQTNRLQSIMASMGEGVLLLNRQGHLLLMNPAAEQMLGLTAQTDVAARLKDIDGLHEKLVAPALNGEEIGHVEVCLQPLGYQQGAWLSVSARPIRDNAGRLEGSVMVFRDVTWRKRSQELLREREVRYRRLVETSPDAILINKADRIVFMNSAGLRLFGATTPEQVVGKTMLELFHSECHALINAHLHRLRMFHEPAPLVEEKIIRLDGSIVDVEVAATPFSDIGETAIQLLVRDISERKRGEAERQQLLNHRLLLLESTGEGMYGIDLDGRCTFINKAALAMFGYHPDEVQGKTMHALVHHSHQDGLPYPSEECKILAAFRKGEGCHGDDEVMWRKDGTSFSVRYSSFPIMDGGVIKGAVVAVTDITERKRADTALKASEQQFASFMDNLPGFAWIKDAQGRLLYLNRLFQGTLLREVDWKGKTAFDLWPAEFAAQYESNDRKVLAAKAPLQGVESYMQDGEVRHSLVSKFPIFDRENTAMLIGGMAVDITESRQAEEKLRRLNRLIELSYEPILVWDFENGIVEWNQGCEQLYGYRRTEALGQNSYRLLKTVAPMSPEEIRRRLQVQKSWTGELCHTTRDGREVIIESRQQLVVNEGRRLVLETNRDITERKRVEAELKRSVDQLHALSQRLEVVREEERSRIARELHDELGVMLTCLKMDLSRLTVLTRDASDQDRSKTEEKIRSMTEHVDNTIASVQRLVAELRPGVLDDLGLVAALEWQCQDFERRSGIACSCECDQEEIDVPASCSTAAFRICREALMNVVRHAQATMAHVRLKHEDEHLRLDIRDNGSGIPSDKLTDSRSLGLLGMRERAETLRGHLEITGWPGQGTTVTVRFPLAQPVRRETEA